MASRCMNVIFPNIINFHTSFILADINIASRAVLCHQQTRGRRRSCRPPQWFTRKEAKGYNEAISRKNKEFLQEVVSDTYKGLETSPLKDGPYKQNPWHYGTRRTGVLALKLGSVPQWTKSGKRLKCYLLQVLDNHVIRYNTPEQFQASTGWKPKWSKKFGSVVVGALSCDPHKNRAVDGTPSKIPALPQLQKSLFSNSLDEMTEKFSKEYNNLFAEAGVPPKRRLTRFLVTQDAAIQPGTPLTAMHFKVGSYVDVQAKSIDHGFQGVVGRWGFAGGRASHGTTKAHRRRGTTGGGLPSGIWKGTKMPGHMGSNWSYHKGCKIYRINTKYNILYVAGSIPGPPHCYVRIYDTVLPLKLQEQMRQENRQPMPTYYPDDNEPVPEELFDKDLFQFTEESIVYSEEEEKVAKS